MVQSSNNLKIKKTIKNATSTTLDDLYIDYIASYFEDNTNDFSREGLVDFLKPFLFETQDQWTKILDQLVDLTKTHRESQPDIYMARKLDARIKMLDDDNETLLLSEFDALNKPTGAAGDIRHVTGRKGRSIVNTKKLREAEARIQKKREKRGEWLDADGIPIWNPNIKPDIIVNQMKASGNTDSSRSKDIKLENFDIAFAGKRIVESASLSLNYGRRYGLVGKNGIGKSTLLKAIASKELKIPDHIKVLHVEQEAAGDKTAALQSVLEADVELCALWKEEKRLNAKMSANETKSVDLTTATNRIKEVYARLEELDADRAEARASTILSGLGFTSEQQRASANTFSGGWRMRLALARALFCKPDLLLADEVTNYLDFPAVVWLENYFQNWEGTILLVSHDRSFLDSVSTDILHMHAGLLEHYKSNFTMFVATREERYKNLVKEYESQLAYRQHLQSFIDRWRYNANRAAQAQSKIKILEKLPPLVPPPKDDMEGLGDGDSVYFQFNDPEKISPPFLQMTDVVFGYTSEKIILRNINFDLQMDSKIAIVGPNGAGKSTLVHLLVGDISPTKGICDRHGRLRIALFSQHHVDQLELGQSSVQFLQKKFPGKVEEEYRRILARYGLTGTTALQPIGTLSGGQKSRTVFAWMAMSNPHVLILDEPTNHLDMDSIDALAKAIKAFKGGVLIVSHDERFLDSVCNEVWICAGGKMSRFKGKEGNTSDGVVKQYKNSLLAAS